MSRLGAVRTAPYFSRLLLIAVMAFATFSNSSAAAISEQALTAAYLYNFLKFAEWPQGTVHDKLTLCITENAVFGRELEAVAGRSVRDRSVRIKRLELGENPAECQLLFLPREEKLIRIREWLKNAGNSPTIVVSDMDSFLDIGGMIALVNDGSRLQFEVNLERVNQAGLKLNSQLLKIAREVKGQ